MLDRMLDFPYTLWLVAAALYLIDTLHAVRPDQVLLEEAPGGALRPRLARVPFEWSGRHLYAVAPGRPDRAAWRARLGTAASAAVLRAEWARLDALSRALNPWRVLAVVNALLLFVAAPLVTRFHGLGVALWTCALPAYGVALVAALMLWWRAPLLALSRTKAAQIGAELLLCIPYSANVVKKITAALPLTVDGLALARMRLTPDALALLEAALQAREETT